MGSFGKSWKMGLQHGGFGLGKAGGLSYFEL